MDFDEAALARLADDVVHVRRLREEDFGPMLDALADPEISNWVHQIPFPYSESDARFFFDLAEREWRERVGAHLAIEHTGCGRFCGTIALNRLDHLYRSAWMGYWVAADHRGQGLATHAARIVVRWAFDHVGVERLSLTAEPENLASQRVAQKCGFVQEGVMRSAVRGRRGRKDSVLFSLLPSDVAS
ncbi:MAG: GNAT family N-acetyltransferase [Actinomycetota bacterium]|nr:GNAT family N-acetyltransferase [Actinomycetota bacterium]